MIHDCNWLPAGMNIQTLAVRYSAFLKLRNYQQIQLVIFSHETQIVFFLVLSFGNLIIEYMVNVDLALITLTISIEVISYNLPTQIRSLCGYTCYYHFPIFEFWLEGKSEFQAIQLIVKPIDSCRLSLKPM